MGGGEERVSCLVYTQRGARSLTFPESSGMDTRLPSEEVCRMAVLSCSSGMLYVNSTIRVPQ